MVRYTHVVLWTWLVQCACAVKVKVVMHSEQDDSKIEDEDFAHTDAVEHRRRELITMMPFIKHHKQRQPEEKADFDEERITTEKLDNGKPHQMHPNEMFFPLIYRQNHINSMFKFGENWYTWSTEKRTDGSKAINYYICYDEPKHCDEVGWERTDSLPKCAFQIDSLLPDDRACINSFGVEPHNGGGVCDGAEQMKVADIVHSCGPRIRSLWRFFRVGRRPANVAKPADVNSLICEDEEECYITIEYRVHHDRITFSLHEPTRGQTFKSALKRDVVPEDTATTEASVSHIRVRKSKKREQIIDDSVQKPPAKKFHSRNRSNKVIEGKGLIKDRNDAGYKRAVKNRFKMREDVSEDISE